MPANSWSLRRPRAIAVAGRLLADHGLDAAAAAAAAAVPLLVCTGCPASPRTPHLFDRSNSDGASVDQFACALVDACAVTARAVSTGEAGRPVAHGQAVESWLGRPLDQSSSGCHKVTHKETCTCAHGEME
jgi:deoxycytidylate deaminase